MVCVHYSIDITTFLSPYEGNNDKGKKDEMSMTYKMLISKHRWNVDYSGIHGKKVVVQK